AKRALHARVAAPARQTEGERQPRGRESSRHETITPRKGEWSTADDRMARSALRRRSPDAWPRTDQYWSEESTSPLARVPRDHQTVCATESLMNRMLPSARQTLTPPGW